jgi:RNA polymerase sigma-70 factor (ECF subfamily)
MLDGDVKARLARGDVDGAAAAAIEGLGPSVFGYLCNVLDEDDARDVFSMFAEDVWRGIAGFRGEATLRVWAFRVAWRAAARFRRDAWHRRGERLPSSLASRLADSVVQRSSAMPGGRQDRLSRLRATLDPEERTLLVLRIDRELEWDEVAAVLADDGVATSSAALRKRFERLKQKLARLAREQGLLD